MLEFIKSKHGNIPKRLYKYTSCMAAKNILLSNRLRYSSPFTFNDIFEFKVFNNTEFNIQKMPNIKNIIEDFKNQWYSIAYSYKILCLSEKNNIEPMWAHYSDNFRGVVLAFEANIEKDSVLLLSKQMTYNNQKNFPIYKNDFINYILYKKQVDINTIMDRIIYTKSIDWQYEREWRVIYIDDNKKYSKYININFIRDELKEIYFGYDTSEQDKKDILDLIMLFYPTVKIYNMDICNIGIKFNRF